MIQVNQDVMRAQASGMSTGAHAGPMMHALLPLMAGWIVSCQMQ
jgi:hypothetical protein